jgi:hypothetical protein
LGVEDLAGGYCKGTTINSVTGAENHEILVYDGSADALQTCFAFALRLTRRVTFRHASILSSFLPDSVYR